MVDIVAGIIITNKEFVLKVGGVVVVITQFIVKERTTK